MFKINKIFYVPIKSTHEFNRRPKPQYRSSFLKLRKQVINKY